MNYKLYKLPKDVPTFGEFLIFDIFDKICIIRLHYIIAYKIKKLQRRRI